MIYLSKEDCFFSDKKPDNLKCMCPSLASSAFGRSLPNSASKQTAMETSEVFSKEDLCPLFSELGKLHCLVDDHILTQQTASTSKVGSVTSL